MQKTSAASPHPGRDEGYRTPAPCDLPATTLVGMIRARTLSPVELLSSCLDRIGRVNPTVNAVVTLDADGATAAARQAEERVMRGGSLGPLHGLPVLVKDTDDVAGMRTTYGSPLFADHVPRHDIGVVARLRAAGAIILGKTNIPEWAAGGNTRNPVHGATGYAFDPALSAAGSSGGSAVALACGMAPLATGTDMAGSLRNPAAFNGVVGFRPSPGLVPNERRGIAWSCLTTNGPMARSVPDAALMLSAMADDDGRDPLAYTLPGEAVRGRPERYLPPPEARLSGLRLAFTEDLGFAPTERHIRRVFRNRVASLAPLFDVAEEATPDCTGADDSFAVLRASLFLQAHGGNFRERPDALGLHIRRNVEEGLGYRLEDYARAATIQTRIYRGFQEFFARYDVLISPAVTLSPRPWREAHPAEIDGQPTRSYFHWLALAYGVTLAGHPAISLPMGLDECGLPFGVQIVGPRGGDGFVLGVAAALERAFESDPLLRRPRPDLERLSASSPISQVSGFRDWQ